MNDHDIFFLPKHVVIIPDGNRRWARALGKKPWEGHKEGAKNTENIIKKANELGVECVSFWGSSQDNLKKRPLEEKRALLKIYLEYFTKMLQKEEIHKNEVRIRIVGEWEEQFPENLKNILYDCIENTKQYSKKMLNFFLAYNGDREMLSAIREIAQTCKDPKKINKDTIKQHLFTHDLPPVDYLIRTGGEPHLSTGFMMWDIANAQLYFSQDNYPDFTPDKFAEAIEDFSLRKRRLGA